MSSKMLEETINKINNFIGGGLVRKFVIWILIIIMLLGFLTNVLVQMSLTQTLSEELSERGYLISRNLATSSVEPILIEDMVNLHRIVEKIKETENDVKYIYITDGTGKVLAHTFEDGFPAELLAVHKDHEESIRFNTGDDYVIDFDTPILDGRVGVVHIGMAEKSMREKIAGTSNLIITLTLLVGVLGVFMAYFAGNYLTRPIRALVKGTEEIGRGNLGYQIEGHSTDEIHFLSKAFNQMSNNLNNSIKELRTSRERYKNLVDGISDAVILIDSQQKILSWNTAAKKMFNYDYEEVAGREINILYSSSEGAITGNNDDFVGNSIFIKKDGSTFPGVVNSKHLQVGEAEGKVVVIRNISEQKEKEKLQKQLLQADKLATLGQLAAGVAHEINNPLANISLYTQMLLKKTEDENVGDKLKVIYDEANRAARISKGLLEFARQSDPKPSPTDLNLEIKEALSILNPKLKEIKITTVLKPIPLIKADSGQIRQVIMNILTNSIQSITTKGEIIVKTWVKESYVETIISDNGGGIPSENLDKIFDPFFTTKALGEGTGLGLSICYGIIRNHNGSIDVESKVGTGTTFTIRLPI